MKLKSFIATTAMAAVLATGASAAVYSVVPTAPAGQNDFTTQIATFFGGAGNVGYGTLVGVTAGVGETLTFKGYGSESSFVNSFTVDDGTPETIVEHGDPFGTGDTITGTFTGVLASTALQFTSNGGVTASIGDYGMGVFYDLTGTVKALILAYDDQNQVDDNHDDFLVATRGSVSAVPLPASSLLLLGGLGGIVALRRKKKSA